MSKSDEDIVPVAYKIENIKSIKEDKIKLTAPIFCQLEPSMNGFNVTNSYKISSSDSMLVNQQQGQLVILNDLLVYLTANQPFF